MRRDGHFEGHWWFPGIAETGASGALECGDEITLTLHGLVLTENQKWMMELGSLWSQGVKALGESLGQPIVLREVHLLSYSNSGESRFWVSTALVGTHALDSERESYDGVTIQIGYLTAWVNHRAFSMAPPFDALGVLHKPQKVYVADIPGARVKLHGGGGRQMRRFSVTMNHQSALTVDVASPHILEDLDSKYVKPPSIPCGTSHQ